VLVNLLSFMLALIAFSVAVFAVLLCVWWACQNEVD
jgi:nitrogen fixation-related uncharacterized protein